MIVPFLISNFEDSAWHIRSIPYIISMAMIAFLKYKAVEGSWMLKAAIANATQNAPIAKFLLRLSLTRKLMLAQNAPNEKHQPKLARSLMENHPVSCCPLVKRYTVRRIRVSNPHPNFLYPTRIVALSKQ